MGEGAFLPCGEIEQLTPADVSALREMTESEGWRVCMGKVFPNLSREFFSSITKAATAENCDRERMRFHGFVQTVQRIISSSKAPSAAERPKKYEPAMARHLGV